MIIWDKRGLLKPDIITAGGHRRYKNKNRTDVKRRVIAYARVPVTNRSVLVAAIVSTTPAPC